MMPDRVMAPAPLIWRCLMEVCQVPAEASVAGWQALRRAQWSKACAWRRSLLLFEERPPAQLTPDAVQLWVDAHGQPQQLIAVLEQLVQEHLLTRRRALQLEEHILAMTDATGRWK